MIVPAVDARKVVKQDHKGHKTGYVCQDHAEGGNDEIRPETHFAFQVLDQDFSVDRKIKGQASFPSRFHFHDISLR
jgi:hypothetical protein